MLHLFSPPVLQQELLERVADGDDVILQQTTALIALNGHAGNNLLSRLIARQCRIFVLQEVLVLHGVEFSQIMRGVNIIDYAGFVELAVKNPVIFTWC